MGVPGLFILVTQVVELSLFQNLFVNLKDPINEFIQLCKLICIEGFAALSYTAYENETGAPYMVPTAGILTQGMSATPELSKSAIEY